MLTAGQVTPTTSSAAFFDVPPGPSDIVISNSSGVNVFIGGPNAVTTSNGFEVPTGTLFHLTQFRNSAGIQLNIIAGSGSITGTASWLISTDS